MLATGCLPLRQEGQVFSLLGSSEEDDDDSIYSESSGDDNHGRIIPQQTLYHRPRQWARHPSASLQKVLGLGCHQLIETVFLAVGRTMIQHTSRIQILRL